MMKLVFGIIYILIAAVFALHSYLDFSSFTFSIALCVYLIVRGVAFMFIRHTLLSTLDSITGLYFLMLFFEVFPDTWVTALFVLYLLQKGFTRTAQGLSGSQF